MGKALLHDRRKNVVIIQDFKEYCALGYDFMPERLKALELWEKRLTEVIEGRESSGLK